MQLKDDASVKSKGRCVNSWTAYAAALWALIFAGFHVIWATGWYVGLDVEQAQIAFSKTPFFVYDLASTWRDWRRDATGRRRQVA